MLLRATLCLGSSTIPRGLRIPAIRLAEAERFTLSPARLRELQTVLDAGWPRGGRDADQRWAPARIAESVRTGPG